MSTSSAAARVYAQAILTIAMEKDRLDAVMGDLHAVMQVLHEDRTLWGLFTSPRIDREEKEAMFRKAFAGKVGDEVLGLLVTMIRKGREPLLDNVVDQFVRFKDKAEGRIHVYVTSARDLDAGIRESITKTIAEVSGKTVTLHEKTDAALVGGMVVRVGDAVVDGSLRTRLRKLRRRLLADHR